MSERELIAVLPMAELRPGELHACTAGGFDVLLCEVNGEVLAVENRCTHANARLEHAALRTDEVICPLHGARFSLRDGRVVSPPARRPLRVFEVVQQGDVLHIVAPPGTSNTGAR